MKPGKISSTNREIYFIGYNGRGEFGLGHSQSLKQLTRCPDTSITKMYPSDSYTIYTDDSGQNMLVAGYNWYGQCCINTNESVETYKVIEYFKKQQINIAKICVTVSGDSTFFITDKNKLYGCGRNTNDQLGINNINFSITKDQGIVDKPVIDLNNKHEPVLISQLNNIIDVKSASYHSIALCSSDNEILLMIIKNWSRLYMIPNDIFNIMIMFSKSTTVYSTVHSGFGHGDKYSNLEYEPFGWREIETFHDKDIIKISTGCSHSLFLESNGTVWSCGENTDGQLGFGNTKDVQIPEPIKYFVDNDIKIKDFSSGFYHNLALDYNGNVYSWGYNLRAQCGDGTVSNILKPKIIEYLKEYSVDIIQCGYYHSYCKTQCDKHFCWGCNDDNECVTFDNTKEVLLPHRIDKIVKNKCNGKSIVEASLGYYSTKIICE